jgi:PPK2 family polyphosphate:nucleotide phosphotransferase
MSNLFTKLIIQPGSRIKLGEMNPIFPRFQFRKTTLPEVRPHVRRPDPNPHVRDFYREFLIAPGRQVKLGEIDPGYQGNFDAIDAAMPETRSLVRRLDELQYLMHAEKKHSLLIVLQGMDACGKDGAIRHIFSGMNPAGCRVVGFKRPKQEELDHDFLWRVHPHLPAKGEVTIFNRSHYEDVLVVRVHSAQVAVWSKRYELINDFERLLVTENDTTVLKFFLYISKAEQLARFKQRLEDPTRRWKISEADYEERMHWNAYVHAFEEMLYRTSTVYAPWFVIPSNHKWFRDLAISQIVNRALEDLEMKLPEPSVDMAAIRRRYHLETEASDPS